MTGVSWLGWVGRVGEPFSMMEVSGVWERVLVGFLFWVWVWDFFRVSDKVGLLNLGFFMFEMIVS